MNRSIHCGLCSNGQYTWGKCYCRCHCSRKTTLIAVILALLFLPAFTYAQSPHSQPLQFVSDCIADVYDECQLVQGHWYHRKGAVWTRDDGKAEAPPVMPVVVCPVQQAVKEPSRYDWSFIKDWKLYAGVGASFTVTRYDISTSHGQEHTRLLRGSNGELSKGRYYGLTALVNVGFLPLDLQPNRRWRWVSLGGRVGLALIRWNVARGNR